MSANLDKFFRDYFTRRKQEIVDDILALAAIESVHTEALPGAPFGQGPKDALTKMLEIARREGFAARNVADAVCEVRYGEGAESLGVLAHLDVVPAGEGWSHPPFEPYFDGELLHGRGVSDNKGACVISLYALAALREAGVAMKREVILLFGTNEESGFDCIRTYLKENPAPTMAYSPDGGFPAVYAEKNIAQMRLSVPLGDDTAIKVLRGGTAPNVVPPGAQATLTTSRPTEQIELPENVVCARTNGDIQINAKGAPAHAAWPWQGKNAVAMMLSAVSSLMEESDSGYAAVKAMFSLCAQWDGQGLGVKCADDVSGPLTMNAGVMDIEDGKLCVTLDFRLPVTLDMDAILRNAAQNAADVGVQASIQSASKGLYVPEDSELVSTLMGVYNEINQSDERPMAMGGGTYARLLPNAVAFGPGFAGEESNAHMADEYANYASLEKAGVIYAHAMARLAGK